LESKIINFEIRTEKMLNKKKIILYLKVILFTVKNDEIDKQANEK